VSTYGSFRLPPIFPGSDIRYGNRGTEPKLAGGGLMDTGAYAVNATRFYVDATIVGCAEAKLHEAYPQIDSRATATLTLRLKDGTEVPGVVESAIAAPFPWLSIPRAKVMCANGTLEVVNFLLPSMYHAINVYDKAGKLLRTERHYGAGQTSCASRTWSPPSPVMTETLTRSPTARKQTSTSSRRLPLRCAPFSPARVVSCKARRAARPTTPSTRCTALTRFTSRPDGRRARATAAFASSKLPRACARGGR